MLQPQLPSDDHSFGQMGALDGDIAQVRPVFVHALRVDHAPQLQTFANFHPGSVLDKLLQFELLYDGRP